MVGEKWFRNCETCAHRVPILDREEGIWKGANCDSWDCEYVNRKKAIQAYKEKYGNKDGAEGGAEQ